jgi:peptidyl-prolyl cis-trans isomerase D
MLEQLRQSSRSFIIWILFGIIILVFIISFGPQADQQIGCGASDSSVMEVNGSEIDDSSWRYAINGLPRVMPQYVKNQSREQRATVAMDLLLSRELLAQAADDAGFRVSIDLVNEKLKQGEWYFLGAPPGKDWFFIDGYFNFDALERHSNSLGLTSVGKFIDEQRRELAAEAMRRVILSGVDVSREELMSAFLHESTQVSANYVRFRVSDYKRIVLTPDMLESYLGDNEAEVKKKYDAEAVNYKETKPAVKLSQIYVARTFPAPSAPPPEEDESGTRLRPPPAAEADPAEDVANKAHARLEAGESFGAVARDVSQDVPSARKGGLLGWRRLDATGLPDKALSEAVQTLASGKHTGVLATKQGFYILAVDGKREGDLSFDQVKHEIAEDMALESHARKAARADATAALALVKAGTPLADLFERAQVTPDGIDWEKIKQQMPPGTDIEQLRKQLEQGGGPDTGSLDVVGPAIPAEWQGGEPAADPPPKPPVTVVPAKRKPAVTVTPAATGLKAPPPPKDDKSKKKPVEIEAAGAPTRFTSPEDGLVRPDGLLPPQLQAIAPFPRHPSRVRELGESPEAVKALFDELEEGQVAPQIFEIGGDYVLLELADKRDPDLAQFEKNEADLLASARRDKGLDVLGEWLKGRCEQVAKDGSVSVNTSYLTFQDDKGNNVQTPYKPCQFF